MRIALDAVKALRAEESRIHLSVEAARILVLSFVNVVLAALTQELIPTLLISTVRPHCQNAPRRLTIGLV